MSSANKDYFESKEHLDIYAKKRGKGAYNSEAYFIERALRAGDTALDVGCARGGYFPILRAAQSSIKYTGILLKKL